MILSVGTAASLKETSMALFKLTFQGTTDKVTVNLDQIRFMRQYPDYTVIRFSQEQGITVAEAVKQILSDNPDKSF
jgi:hypothetical protein